MFYFPSVFTNLYLLHHCSAINLSEFKTRYLLFLYSFESSCLSLMRPHFPLTVGQSNGPSLNLELSGVRNIELKQQFPCRKDFLCLCYGYGQRSEGCSLRKQGSPKCSFEIMVESSHSSSELRVKYPTWRFLDFSSLQRF